MLLAIKSRLRALRLASGGSIDLAGVRDRVLDSLYKQQLAAEERRGRRAAHARDQERLAAQMAARFVGERIRAESVDRRNERLHESDDRTRRTPLGSAGSEDSSSEDRADRRRRARDLSTPRRTCAAAESPRDVRREERGRRVSPRRAGSRGKRGAASQARASDFDDDDRRPARPRSRGGGDRRGWEESDTGESADVTRERRQAQRHDAEFTNSDSSSGPRFGGTVETAGDGRQTRGRRRHGGASRSPLSPTTERRAAHDAAQGRRSAQASARASVASASTTGSLFLSGPSTNFSHPRTPLFHNVEHVLHARRWGRVGRPRVTSLSHLLFLVGACDAGRWSQALRPAVPATRASSHRLRACLAPNSSPRALELSALSLVTCLAPRRQTTLGVIPASPRCTAQRLRQILVPQLAPQAGAPQDFPTLAP